MVGLYRVASGSGTPEEVGVAINGVRADTGCGGQAVFLWKLQRHTFREMVHVVLLHTPCDATILAQPVTARLIQSITGAGYILR